MEKRHLTRWNVHWMAATRSHPAYAFVHLYGTETHFLKVYRVYERFQIPLEPGYSSDHKATIELVKRAMQMSQNKWTGRV